MPRGRLSPPPRRKTYYGYDDASRLTSETVGNGTPTTWSYDWVGNRGTGSNYNNADEYLAGSGYVYDDLGNLEYVPNDTASTRTRYHYNGDNLLSQVDDVVSGNTTSTTITWDADQQRLELQRGDDTWQLIYDPTAGVPSVLLAIASAGDTTHYTREPGGELLGYWDGLEAYNYYYDALGSTVLMSYGGTPSAGYAYDAWGNEAGYNANEYIGMPYRYVGQLGYYQHDPNGNQGIALEGLLQLGVRSYDAGVGRFTQRDPIQAELDDYAYSAATPTLATDPSGMETAVIPRYPSIPLPGLWKCVGAMVGLVGLVAVLTRTDPRLSKCSDTYADCHDKVKTLPPSAKDKGVALCNKCNGRCQQYYREVSRGNDPWPWTERDCDFRQWGPQGLRQYRRGWTRQVPLPTPRKPRK